MKINISLDKKFVIKTQLEKYQEVFSEVKLTLDEL